MIVRALKWLLRRSRIVHPPSINLPLKPFKVMLQHKDSLLSHMAAGLDFRQKSRVIDSKAFIMVFCQALSYRFENGREPMFRHPCPILMKSPLRGWMQSRYIGSSLLYVQKICEMKIAQAIIYIPCCNSLALAPFFRPFKV